MKNIENPLEDQETYTQESVKSKSRKLFNYAPLIIGSSMLILVDQWTKALVVKNISFLGTWLPDSLAHYAAHFRIVHWRNSGAAFGMFSDGNIVFLILAIVASIFIISFYPLIENDEWSLRFAMILQLGGAIGNMIDRIRYGYVIDFISVKNFPVFNIADACISLGVAVLLIGVIYQELKSNNSEKLSDSLSLTEKSRQEKAE